MTTYQTKSFAEKRKEALEDERSVGINWKKTSSRCQTDQNQLRSPYLEANEKIVQEDISRKKYHSHNWWKAKTRLDKAYHGTTSIKNDIQNKLVHGLTKQFRTICYEDDAIKAWQRIWGRRILNTSLGEIISALEKKAQTPRKVDSFIPRPRNARVATQGIRSLLWIESMNARPVVS